MTMSSRQMLFAYWLPTVGIGSGTTKQDVHVPLTDVLNYRRSDGTLQIDVVNLMGCTFLDTGGYPLNFDPLLQTALTDGSVQQLQQAGIKVLLTIQGSGESFGWGSFQNAQLPGFVDYLNMQILGTGGLGLDGIDIDNEWPATNDNLIATVQAMRQGMPADKAISKALWQDEYQIPQLAGLLTWGGIMYYGDDAPSLEQSFDTYVQQGMQPSQLTIGVNAGPIAQGGGFTSIGTAQTLAAWQPASGDKLGMMLWTFSQDIQQFTADPQNQPNLMWRNSGDHSWQQAIIEVFDGS
jgi:hypothetical protein